MRLAKAIAEILSQELASCETLQSVVVARIQAAPWDWILFSMAPTGEHSLRTLLSVLMPFRQGELLLISSGSTAYYSTRGIIPESISQDDHAVQRILSESPPEVQRLLIDGPRDGHHGSRIFARLRRDRTLSDVNGLLRIIRDSTWFAFRSLPLLLQKRRVDVVLGAQAGHIAALDVRPISAAETDNAHVAIFPAPASAAVSVRILTPVGSTKNSKLPAVQVADALGVPLRTRYGFAISLPLEVEVLSRISHHSRNDLLKTLQSCAALLHSARVHCERSIEHGIDQTIRLVEERRQRTRLRQTVSLVREAGPPRVVGSVPTNEHEVLILTGKLEVYIRRIVPTFCIWEHTAQSGIDALADIQLSKDSAPAHHATLEFEFELGNFFRHSHPIRQTEVIVCWSNGKIDNGIHYYGDGDFDRRGELSFEMRGRGWIRVLDFGDHLIRVLILRDLPGLHIRKRIDSGT